MKNLLLAGCILIICSCNSQNDKENSATNAAEQPSTASENNTSNEQNNVGFDNVNSEVAQQIIDGYLNIKDALVQTNVDKAQNAAKKTEDQLKNVQDEGLQAIKSSFSEIAGASAVEDQRNYFNELSKQVYAFAKTVDTNQTLYRQHCPMAFKNTGAFWLSSSEEIRNPYFGDKMLKCGRVEESI